MAQYIKLPNGKIVEVDSRFVPLTDVYTHGFRKLRAKVRNDAQLRTRQGRKVRREQ